MRWSLASRLTQGWIFAASCLAVLTLATPWAKGHEGKDCKPHSNLIYRLDQVAKSAQEHSATHVLKAIQAVTQAYRECHDEQLSQQIDKIGQQQNMWFALPEWVSEDTILRISCNTHPNEKPECRIILSP